MAVTIRPWTLRSLLWLTPLRATETLSFTTQAALRSDSSSPPQSKQRWSQHEIDQLSQLDSQEVHKSEWTKFLPGRTLAAIESALKAFRVNKALPRSEQTPWTDNELQILETNKRKHATIAQIKELLPGRSQAAINLAWSKIAPRDSQGEMLQPFRHVFSPEDRQLILDCRERKMTWKQIQQQHFPGVSHKSLWGHIHYSSAARANVEKDWSHENDEQLQALLCEGRLSIKDIAKKMNISYKSTYHRIRQTLQGASASTARPLRKWSKTDLATLVSMRDAGDRVENIVAALSRSSASVRGKLAYLNKKPKN